MKKDIHPEYYTDAVVTCACGNTWTTGSTKKEIRTEVCSKCHPFFTGQQQRIIDMEGQVDRFYRRLQARQEYIDDQQAKDAKKTDPKRPVEELELGKRVTDALVTAGLKNVGKILDKLTEGDKALLDLEGFGRKSLIDLKKSLRKYGYEIPEAAEEITV